MSSPTSDSPSHIAASTASPVFSSPSDINSLPDSASSDDIDDDDDYDGEEGEISDAERQWRESLQQLELLLTMVVVPYVGKYLGRKFAYYGMS